MIKKEVKKLVSRIDRRQLKNNTQRTLLALLTASSEWVSRTSIRVPSVGSRIRDLRKERFGGFRVQCTSARAIERQTRATSTSRQTFYRLDPATVTVNRVTRAFEGVIATTNTK